MAVAVLGLAICARSIPRGQHYHSALLDPLYQPRGGRQNQASHAFFLPGNAMAVGGQVVWSFSPLWEQPVGSSPPWYPEIRVSVRPIEYYGWWAHTRYLDRVSIEGDEFLTQEGRDTLRASILSGLDYTTDPRVVRLKAKLASGRLTEVKPVWQGWLVNALSVGAVALFVAGCATTIGATRDILWARRGRCRRCGYNLGKEYSSPCPECGCDQRKSRRSSRFSRTRASAPAP